MKKIKEAKEAQLQASRSNNKQSQTPDMNPQETIRRLKAEFAKQYHSLKAATNVTIKETVTLVRDESRQFIKETTNFVITILQKEMLDVLR